MKKNRFNVIESSKFNKLDNRELESIKGGNICLLCVKRARRIWKSGLELRT